MGYFIAMLLINVVLALGVFGKLCDIENKINEYYFGAHDEDCL